MAKFEPIFLNDFDQTLYCPIIWIQQMLRETAQLCCSIPAIRAVDDDVLLLHKDFLNDLVYSFQNDGKQLHVASGFYCRTVCHN